MAVTVYTIGVPAGPSGWTIPDQVHAQLRLAHNLREDLVTAELEYGQAVTNVWSSYPRVAQAEWLLAEADHQAAQLCEQIRKERSRQRTKRITGSMPEQLKTQRAEVKRLRQCRRDEIAAIADDAKTRATDLLDQLKSRRKQLYAEYCQAGDLYWATFNAVLDAHIKAVKRIAAERQQGRPATLRHREFDGTGTLSVQLQRQAGKPARTPAVIADPDGKYRNVLSIPWTDPDVWEKMTRAQRAHTGRGTVRMRGGSWDGQPEWIDIRVQAHRMLPADADITGAELTITRIADRYRARLAVTAKLPDPPASQRRPTVAVHIGWRDTPAGIQVATWRSSQPLDIPAEWGGVMRADCDQHVGAIVLPEYVAERIDRADQLRSTRDRDLDRIRDRVVAWLNERGPVPHPTHDDQQLTAADVARWRSRARFAGWPAPGPSSRRPVRLNSSQISPSGGAPTGGGGGSRNICGGAPCAAGTTCGAISPRSSRTNAGRSCWMTPRSPRSRVFPRICPMNWRQPIARRRTLASPGRLRAAIAGACNRDGVPIRVVSAAGLSRVHAYCGHENPADDRYVSRPVRCDGCGAEYDPDLSATTLMLDRAKGDSHAGSSDTARMAS